MWSEHEDRLTERRKPLGHRVIEHRLVWPADVLAREQLLQQAPLEQWHVVRSLPIQKTALPVPRQVRAVLGRRGHTGESITALFQLSWRVRWNGDQDDFAYSLRVPARELGGFNRTSVRAHHIETLD